MPTFHVNLLFRDAIIMCVINSSTSIIAGFVVFSVLGYMANAIGKRVDDVVKSGVGLAFLVYPEAIITLPASQVWSVLFFLMIMILGLDSQVSHVSSFFAQSDIGSVVGGQILEIRKCEGESSS